MKFFKLFKKAEGGDKEASESAEKKGTESKHYLTGKEIRAIAKANSKEMRRLEKYKNRRAPESEYLSEMKDPGDVLEVAALQS